VKTDGKTLGLIALAAGALLFAGKKTVDIIRKYNIDARAKLYLPKVKHYADTYGVDPYLMAGLVAQESSFDPNAFRREAGYRWGTNPDFPDPDGAGPLVGGDASYGLTQILYSNAKDLGYGGEPDGLFDPDMNLHFGTIFFKRLLTYYGNEKDAIAAYNSGRPLTSAPESTTTVYVPHVTGYAAFFRQEAVFA
jgi:soluble lytic murein transglycosylase-like protein